MERGRWVAAREHFFLPVRVLSRLFREKYLACRRETHRADRLLLVGRLHELTSPSAWRVFLERLRQIEWVVYAKPPFGSSEQVLKYLGRYAYRVAISNHRLLSMNDGYVAFRYKDYRRGRSDRLMRLPATEFIRRFLLHILPKRFVRIRHYGLLANRTRKENLTLCRRLLAPADQAHPAGDLHSPTAPASSVEIASCECSSHTIVNRCPACEKGLMLLVAELPPSRAGPNFS